MGNNDNKCIYLDIENTLFEVHLSLRDYMYRFPPRHKGLDSQAKIFGLNAQKIDIESDYFAVKLGVKKDKIKENMSLFKEKCLDDFIKYNVLDLLTTSELDKTQRELLHLLRSSFKLDDVEIADTTGSNVAKFITDLISKTFNNSTDIKDWKQK
ncbi:hypothetical protein, partial [Planktothrix sp.]|uniref:hypothetical protein n=1 Tax=Planktothrix sp. TaxID=3088171 RepID=UPI0038D42FA6